MSEALARRHTPAAATFGGGGDTAGECAGG